MKRLILILPVCFLIMSSCSSVTNVTNTPSASETETDFVLEHQKDLQRVYDTMVLFAPLTSTPEFREEYKKHLEEEFGRTLSYDPICKAIERQDPFSAKLLPVSTPQDIHAGMTNGEIVDRYGIPNYSYIWKEDKTVPETNMIDHAFYYLEDGTVLRIVLKGVLVYNDFIDEYTTSNIYIGSTIGLNWYYKFTVESCDVLSVDELIEQKGYYDDAYRSFWGKEPLESRFDPRDTSYPNPVWHWDDWPEIFVTKYGFPETYVPADDGNDG